MPTVVLACNQLGMGGTERGMATQAFALNRDAFDVGILAVHDSGPLMPALEAGGLRVDVADGQPDRLQELLRGVDVVIQLRPGAAAPLLPAACRAAGVPHIVDWNIFGQVDRSSDESQFACHLFISKTTELRYRGWVEDHSPEFHNRHRVQYLPINPALHDRAPDAREARLRLGLDPDRPVVGRAGRPADVKWRNLLVDMVPGLLRAVPDAQLMFVGATPAKIRRLRRRGVLDRCVLIEQKPDEDLVATSYAACDVFVSASEIGESQGLALLEAMSMGVPVVTCSTPWADNAQLEFVEHGRTGLIANHPRPFAEAVAALLLDPDLRHRLGAGARNAVSRQFDPHSQARQLERLVAGLLSDGRVPSEWAPSPAAVDAFAPEYARRIGLEYRPLRPLERLDAERARFGERAARAMRSLRA